MRHGRAPGLRRSAGKLSLSGSARFTTNGSSGSTDFGAASLTEALPLDAPAIIHLPPMVAAARTTTTTTQASQFVGRGADSRSSASMGSSVTQESLHIAGRGERRAETKVRRQTSVCAATFLERAWGKIGSRTCARWLQGSRTRAKEIKEFSLEIAQKPRPASAPIEKLGADRCELLFQMRSAFRGDLVEGGDHLRVCRKLRCATIMAANSLAISTFESSRAPPSSVPRPPVPGAPIAACPDPRMLGKAIVPGARQSLLISEGCQSQLSQDCGFAIAE